MTSRYTKAREWSGLSVNQAVKLLGWPDSLLLTDIENEVHMPSNGTNRKIADLYGVSAAWLLGSDPVVPLAARTLISDRRRSREDRKALLELFSAIYTPESRR